MREFWRRAERFAGCLVTFNGRGFDLPVLELHALRHGISVPSHFADRRAQASIIWTCRIFSTNRGDFRIRGGLNLLLKSIGMPGKTDIAGSQVQELYEAGRLEEIHRYCRDDVIQTYFLFLRVELMRGRLDQAGYRAACRRRRALSRGAWHRPGGGRDPLMAARPRLALIVIARNEEELIGECLHSASLCDENIVVDSFSTDRTVEIARCHGARVYQREFPGYIAQKQFALGAGDGRLGAEPGRGRATDLRT